MAISEKVPVTGTDITRRKLKVTFQGRGLEVDAYTFQLRAGMVPKFVDVFSGRDQDGRIILKQDIAGVLDTLYEEECTYKFKITGVMKDPKSHASYLMLKDDYGLAHRLYSPNAKGLASTGKIIDCRVDKMESTYMSLSSPKYQTIGDVEVIESKGNISAEDLRLFDILHQKREGQFASMNDHSMRGVWSSVVDKYPDSAHFIYELLQNADDAEATEVSIYLDKDALYFKHNGRIQFSVTDDYDEEVTPGHINAIVAIGDSSKGKDGRQKIGKFGVGFKAVFDYTETPIIYTDTFKFKIENYIVPELISYDSEYREKGETLFEIPFKDPEKAYKEIQNKLQHLENPILFLHNLKKVTWKDLSQFNHEKKYSKTIVAHARRNDVLCQKVYEETPNGVDTLWLFSREVDVAGRGTWPIYIGYFLEKDDDKEKILTDQRQNIYCFFPTTESFGTCFISHAPFLLVDNRQQIKRNEQVNIVLQKELSQLACDTLIILRDIGIESGNLLIDRNLLDIVPKVRSRYYNLDDREDLFSPTRLFQPFLDVLKKEALFLTRSGNYLKYSQVKLAQPVSMVPLLTAEQINLLIGSENEPVDFMQDAPTTKESVYWDYLNSEVGIKVFSSADLAHALTPEFMQEQSMDWVLKLYSFLSQDARELWLQRNDKQTSTSMPFRQAPIVKTDTGEWMPPYKGAVVNVFFASNASQGYNIISDEYFQNERARKFLTELGIKEPELGDYIKTKVLAKYKSDETIYVNEVVDDLEALYEYSLKVPSGELEDYIKDVADKYKVLCEGEKDDYPIRPPFEVYFPTKELKKYFEGFKAVENRPSYYTDRYDRKDVMFLDEKAYSKVLQKYEREKILSFIKRMGVRFTPKIEKVKIHRYQLSDRQRSELGASGFNQHDYEYGEDYRMEGLFWALDHNLNRALSIQIWKWLSANYENTEKLVYKFHYYSYITRYCDSSYVERLKHTPWIYINQRTAKAPAELSIEDFVALSDYPVSQKVFTLLGIEKRITAIEEIEGINEEQIETYHKGEEWRAFLKENGISEKDAKKIIAKEVAERKKKEEKEKEKEKAREAQRASRKDMADYTSAETFGDVTPRPLKENPTRNENPEESAKLHSSYESGIYSSKTTEEKVEEIKQRHQENLDREVKEEGIREEVAQLSVTGGKYSKEWFEHLLELEYMQEGDNVETFGRKSVTLSFSRVEKEVDSDRIYILKNPSSVIPLEVEQIGGLQVQFSFFHDMEDVTFGFEVASVRDFTLRLKAKLVDADKLKEIDWTTCSKATIQINNPVALVKKLTEAFKELGVEPGANLKENLNDNISFVFGPPGTGKTTHLAGQITSLINENEHCRILVLTPTNKACDVIANKIADISDAETWLGRFLTTGSERLENEGYVCDKNSNLYEQNKCCIVTTTARLPYDGFGTGYETVLLKDVEWDYVIIDEASMIPLAQVVYAIYRFQTSQIIIAGDPMQIMPIVREEAWKGENIYTMVNLNRFENPKTEPRQFDIVNLETQYRSVPAIGRIFSEFAYQGRLKHNREASSIKPVNIKGFEDIKPVNFITFKVDRYDNICGAKKLASSNVHIYSVLLVSEMCQYFARQYEKNGKKGQLRIGIICPYAAQAQMIEKLLEQNYERPENVEISVGTIHGFQGDECDVIFAVFNPPKGLKGAPDRVLVNNINILNVAISRARDYLFVFMPQKDTDGFENLNGIINIGKIAIQDRENMTFANADRIEEIIFKEKGYIENNTFVTTHQMTNVYSRPVSKYEVRIDESSVDIQIDSK